MSKALDVNETPVRPRKRQKAERPAQILEAAFDEFAKSGYAATRLEDIAARIGVTKGTIYLYFPSKEDLFKAVVIGLVQPLLDEAEKLIQSYTGSSADLMRSLLLRCYDDMIGCHRQRDMMRLLIAEGGKHPHLTSAYHDEVVSRGEAIIGLIIARGLASGEFRRSALTSMPICIIGPVVHASTWDMMFAAHHPLDLERYKAAHLEMVISALVAGSADG